MFAADPVEFWRGIVGSAFVSLGFGEIKHELERRSLCMTTDSMPPQWLGLAIAFRRIKESIHKDVT
jgi:hypothetical protein